MVKAFIQRRKTFLHAGGLPQRGKTQNQKMQKSDEIVLNFVQSKHYFALIWIYLHEYLIVTLVKKHEKPVQRESEPKKMLKKKNVRKKASFFTELCYNGVKIRNTHLFLGGNYP